MTKIICISDTHNKLGQIKIPHGDILLHAGDGTMRGTDQEIFQLNQDLGNIDCDEKIIIAGNHDWGFQERAFTSRSFITNATYLEDSFVNVKGLKIYGAPWQPWFYDWAFNLQRGQEIKQKWDLIPDDIDVLITHGPPFGIRDIVGPNQYNPLAKNVGCEELASALQRFKNLKLHVFGHIHPQYGLTEINGVKFVNAASLNDHYQVAHEPIIVEL
jgi:Icc-related predicted phosphoesterase